MTTIYNCHHDGDQYRITKFVDGNPESSYLTTFESCECPAGHRDTCRHRQMLPAMLDRNLVNTHLFLAWDQPDKPTCDFEGNTCLGFLVPAEEDTTYAPLRLGEPLITIEGEMKNQFIVVDSKPDTRISPAIPSQPSWRRI
jgi:hypothetical protein